MSFSKFQNKENNNPNAFKLFFIERKPISQ